MDGVTAILLTLAGAPSPNNAPDQQQPACAHVEINLYHGMQSSDFKDLAHEFAKWLMKAKKDCEDPDA